MNTLKATHPEIQSLFNDVGDLMVDGIELMKGKISKVGGLFKVYRDFEKVLKDIPAVLPDLNHFDPEIVVELGADAYALIQKVLAAFKG